MKALTAILLALFSGGCFQGSNGPVSTGHQTNADSSYTWTKLLERARWKEGYNYQLFSVRDTLWVFHPDGSWYSAYRTNWQKSELPNAIGNQAYLDYVQFNGAIYGLGHFEGNIERSTFQPVIYRTIGLKRWEVLTKSSNLPPRFFYHPFVFDKKIWIIGGEDKTRKYADIWSSNDGVNWVKRKDNLPFGRRSQVRIVEKRGTLYLLGDDVWTSKNALDWTRLTPQLVKNEEVFGYAAEVFDDKIWLLGCNRNGRFSSQVLVSGNGIDWKGADAPWSPRGGIASVVHRNRIYMTGGKYGGLPNAPEFIYSNDLWMMGKAAKTR